MFSRALVLLEYPIMLQAAKISLHNGIIPKCTNLTHAGTHTKMFE
jgi:hypothetical protein